MSRYLQSTIRTVTREPSAYLSDWARVSEAAVASNARAWIFRAADSETTFIEFIEWKSRTGDESIPERLAALLSELERHGPGENRTWQET